jgi:hypothetical protein
LGFISKILFCAGTCCHIAFIIFSICGVKFQDFVFNAQILLQSQSFNLTSSNLSLQIVFFISSSKSLKVFVSSSFLAFSSGVFSVSRFISLAVIDKSFASLNSVKLETIHSSIGSVKSKTSIFFSLNCSKYGFIKTSLSDFQVM